MSVIKSGGELCFSRSPNEISAMLARAASGATGAEVNALLEGRPPVEHGEPIAARSLTDAQRKVIELGTQALNAANGVRDVTVNPLEAKADGSGYYHYTYVKNRQQHERTAFIPGTAVRNILAATANGSVCKQIMGKFKVVAPNANSRSAIQLNKQARGFLFGSVGG